jgi:hypothetical protein
MKRQKYLKVAIVALAVALLVAAGSVAAKATKTPVTGTECYVENIEEGTYWFSEDGVFHLRGYVQLNSEESTDPRVVGSNTVVVNANWRDFDPDTGYGVGPMWGTYHIDVDGIDGSWDGTWTGMVDADGRVSTRARAKGNGDLEGQKISVTVERTTSDLCGDFTGHILDPHGE